MYLLIIIIYYKMKQTTDFWSLPFFVHNKKTETKKKNLLTDITQCVHTWQVHDRTCIFNIYTQQLQLGHVWFDDKSRAGVAR